MVLERTVFAGRTVLFGLDDTGRDEALGEHRSPVRGVVGFVIRTRRKDVLVSEGFGKLKPARPPPAARRARSDGIGSSSELAAGALTDFSLDVARDV